MVDLEPQLRAYATVVLDRIEPVSPDEVVQPAARARRSRRRAGLVAAAALLAVLVATPVVWLAVRSSETAVNRVASESDRRNLPTNWTRIDGLVDAQVTASASSSLGVVAVGRGIWFSADGTAWRTVLEPTENNVPWPQQAVITDVTSAGRGFLAAGQGVDPTSGQAVAAVWRSPDGQHWTRVHDPDLEPATPPIPAQNSTPVRGSIQAVARDRRGFVAVGRVFAGRSLGPAQVSTEYAPAIWSSTDGSHWKRVNATSAFGNGPSSWTLTDVVAYRGSMLAVATVQDATVIFESHDHGPWRRIATQPGFFGALVRYHNRLVAVGTKNPVTPRAQALDAHAAVWMSSDARHWREVAAFPDTSTTYHSVATNGRSLVAVGYRTIPTVDGIMSVSSDARRWQTVATSGSAFAPGLDMYAVASFRGGYLAFGTELTLGDATAPGSRHATFLSKGR
jgi:hypothetical protein